MFLPSQPGELPAHFMALANLTRLRMLQRLGVAGEQSVMDLAAYLRMSQPRIAIRGRQMELLRLLETGEVVLTGSEVKA
jgi:hypothetical protein